MYSYFKLQGMSPQQNYFLLINLIQNRFINLLTPKIPSDQKLVNCCLGSLCEEK
jgi:hypothetical protein